MPTFPSTPGYIFPSKEAVEAAEAAEAAEEVDTTPPAEPTFPDIVILKQTEHNYIVKHNHYPIQTTTATGESIDDLVSPNQIHKGQINKKRGRKPKAGLILNSKNGIYDSAEVPNIILHLKCHVSDLKINESISNYDYIPCVNEVESYSAQSAYLQSSDITMKKTSDTDDSDDDNRIGMRVTSGPGSCSSGMTLSATAASAVGVATLSAAATGATGATGATAATAVTGTTAVTTATLPATTAMAVTNPMIGMESAPIHILNERSQRETMKKIQRLKHSFHNGETVQTKMNHKSACFWDTCEFDGPVYYIPIMIVNGVFQVSGCYCSPQCALAALLKEPLDTSTKFERLHLLQLLYGAPNGGGKGFKPAPNPHYLLDKFYGNLTIQEYRMLSKGSVMIHVVNKPLTHILPELYEDNNDFMVNSKVIPTNTLKMKKKYKTMVVQGGAE
jgi:hypothetical protein